MVPESEIEQVPMEPENTIGKFPILQKKYTVPCTQQFMDLL